MDEKHILKQFRSDRGCLSYILTDKESGKSIIIDPSEEVPTENYLSYIEEHGFELVYVLDTHTHADHVSSSLELRDKTRAKIVMHKKSPTKRKDVVVDDGDVITVGNIDIDVLYTPGHTDESITLHYNGIVFSGDVLLIGATGRTDFQNGNSRDLYNSLWEKILMLDDSIHVYPAHDYQNRSHTTIGDEKRSNPRLKWSKDEFIETMDAYHPPAPDLFEVAIPKNSE